MYSYYIKHSALKSLTCSKIYTYHISTKNIYIHMTFILYKTSNTLITINIS